MYAKWQFAASRAQSKAVVNLSKKSAYFKMLKMNMHNTYMSNTILSPVLKEYINSYNKLDYIC